MPELPNNVPRYTSTMPYYWTYDNLPIDGLIQRDDIINEQVDANTAILEQAAGDAGTLPVRLNQSMDSLGNLTSLAVNTSLHNIGYHTDGKGPDNVSYVRMTQAERDKLATVATDATNFSVQIQTATGTGGSLNLDSIVLFDQNYLTFEPSPTVTWSVADGQKVTANVVAQPDGHMHYDSVLPVPSTPTPDYRNYLTGTSDPFLSGSLKVYINGIRIYDTTTVYATSMSGVALVGTPTFQWVPRSFTPTVDKLGFSLNSGLSSQDVIMIDFRVSTTA